MNTLQHEQLFTNLTPEQAAVIEGGYQSRYFEADSVGNPWGNLTSVLTTQGYGAVQADSNSLTRHSLWLDKEDRGWSREPKKGNKMH